MSNINKSTSKSTYLDRVQQVIISQRKRLLLF